MSKYTTGGAYETLQMTVRTVHIMDKECIFGFRVNFSEVGKKIIPESDLQRLKVICFSSRGCTYRCHYH